MRAVTETNLGVTLQAEGRLDEAADHYHRAIALAPDYPPAYNNLATALRAKGQLAGRGRDLPARRCACAPNIRRRSTTSRTR